MKRILVTVDKMLSALVTLNVNGEQAADNACQQLGCRPLFRGVIRRLKGCGGYVVLNAQDHVQV